MRAVIFPCNSLNNKFKTEAQRLDYAAGFKVPELCLLPTQFSYLAAIILLALTDLVYETQRVPVKLELDVCVLFRRGSCLRGLTDPSNEY